MRSNKLQPFGGISAGIELPHHGTNSDTKMDPTRRKRVRSVARLWRVLAHFGIHIGGHDG